MMGEYKHPINTPIVLPCFIFNQNFFDQPSDQPTNYRAVRWCNNVVIPCLNSSAPDLQSGNILSEYIIKSLRKVLHFIYIQNVVQYQQLSPKQQKPTNNKVSRKKLTLKVLQYAVFQCTTHIQNILFRQSGFIINVVKNVLHRSTRYMSACT